MIQETLNFNRQDYPNSPGYKDNDTSREAAESVAYDSETLRAAVYSALKTKGAMTADEAAEYLGQHFLSIRPRITELKAKGKIQDSGVRRKNLSGKNAKVWEIIN